MDDWDDGFGIGDTVLHSWEVLASILSSEKTLDILCDIGMCVQLFILFSLFWYTNTHPFRKKANNAQERDIQLPRDHSQP